ncbi:hypothetical protein CsSME_00007263 [Camellia sinensis var. sinensis]
MAYAALPSPSPSPSLLRATITTLSHNSTVTCLHDMQDIAEHLTTIYLKRCERGKPCLYEGSTAEGFPNSWNGATYCTSDLSVLKNNEIHTWDRGYDDDGNQVHMNSSRHLLRVLLTCFLL